MYTITKEFHFSASHQLDHLPKDHPCARLHGHNYVVILELSHDTLQDGFVRDFRDLDEFKRMIDDQVDHRHLNDVLGAGYLTTSERLARWFFEWAHNRWPEVTAVTVCETPKTSATYRPSR